MLNTIRDKSLNILESIYQTLDSYEETQKRPKVFSMRKDQENDDQKDSNEESQKDGSNEGGDQEPVGNDVNYDELSTNEKFKYLTFELIDIGLFQGQKGLDYIQSTTPYTLLDKNL